MPLNNRHSGGCTLQFSPKPQFSYVDIYWLLAMGSVIMFVGSFLLKRNEPGKGAKVSVH